MIDGKTLKNMFLNGAAHFEIHKEIINKQNVFPVPDGDTGTNMSLTLSAAVKKLENISEQESLKEVVKAASQASLMGARGNSGVILSQLFQGIAKILVKKNKASIRDLGKAFQYGMIYAYNSVSRPVEGTILTVVREISKGSKSAVKTNQSVTDLLKVAIKSGRTALEKTPEQLPVLKEAGVVDAGGLGLIIFLEGCLKGFSQDISTQNYNTVQAEKLTQSYDSGLAKSNNFQESFDSSKPYCTELFLKGSDISIKSLRQEFEQIGDSVIVAGDSDAVKVHLHTNHPGKALDYCLSCGTIHDIKIDNMLDQYQKFVADRNKSLNLLKPENQNNNTTAIIAVAAGDGLKEVFESAGASFVLNGMNTMNPSVQDFIRAIDSIPSEKIIILPNNSNIKSAAQQAASLCTKEVAVADTQSIPQGLSCLLGFNQEASLSENMAEIAIRARQVTTIEIATVTRNASIDGVKVTIGDYIGIIDGKVSHCCNKIEQVLLKTVTSALENPEEQILTIFYGKEVTSQQADHIEKTLESEFNDLEVELHYGGQPVYQYIISIE